MLSKPIYDLEERTFQFARKIRLFIKGLPYSITNNEDTKQLIRSSGSIGANYREANEALSKKDLLLKLKISRKEAKESVYWLRLLREINNPKYFNKIDDLINEANELKKILSAIILKCQKPKNHES